MPLKISSWEFAMPPLKSCFLVRLRMAGFITEEIVIIFYKDWRSLELEWGENSLTCEKFSIRAISLDNLEAKQTREFNSTSILWQLGSPPSRAKIYFLWLRRTGPLKLIFWGSLKIGRKITLNPHRASFCGLLWPDLFCPPGSLIADYMKLAPPPGCPLFYPWLRNSIFSRLPGRKYGWRVLGLVDNFICVAKF